MNEPKIRFVDLASQRKEAALEKIFAGFREIYESSQFVMGQRVAEFESRYAELAGCSEGIGLNSGTDGLFLALRALGVGEGDEVITASNSFVATAGAIVIAGAKPVFSDIAEDMNLDPKKIEEKITPKTKAIIPVHLTGNPCHMDEIMAIAKKHNLFVVEDAAQAIGATYKGKQVGSFGEVGSFSLHPLKNLHVWGDGGMATTNSKELATALRQQRNHGLKNRDEVEYFAFNSRLDSLQAVVGLTMLDLLNETVEQRIRHARIYDERLEAVSDSLGRPIADHDKVKHVYHLYVVRAQNREDLVKHLLKKGIETKVHYPIPIHLQKASEPYGCRRGDLPVTERLATEILSLPVRENLEDDQIHEVCDAIVEFYKG